MTLPFESLEDKDTMDCYEKATRACGGNQEGVEGMMHLLENASGDFFTVIAGLLIMGTLSVPVMAGMTVLAFLFFLVKENTCYISPLPYSISIFK